jgi:low temperature requirement protein LtrA
MLKRLHGGVAWLFVAAIVVQVFLAGAAIAQLGGSNDFSAHRDFGYTVVGLAALAVVVTAIAARAGRRAILISVGLLALYIVQTILPNVTGFVAALHPVNALLLFALAVWYARRAWRASTPAPA